MCLQDMPNIRKIKQHYFQGAHFMSGVEAVEVGAVNEAVPEVGLHTAVLEYATMAAKQGMYQQKLVKLAINSEHNSL